jgi:hexokinase
VNDTVGTLLSRAYLTGDCLLGAIFGTGTNGAYVEKLQKINKIKTAHGTGDKMIVNTEWGAFDNARRVLPFTPFDNKVDRESINPRFQAFEKFISGMYLGEITRNLLLHLIDTSLLFNAHSTPLLNKHYGFDTALMSEIESEIPIDSSQPRSFTQTRKVFEALGFKPEQITDTDCEIAQWACQTVVTRGAKLSGCAVAAIVKQTEHDKGEGGIGVGVDGSLVEHYPRFEERLREALKVLLGSTAEQRIKIGMAKDGSGVGAALCALQAMKQK